MARKKTKKVILCGYRASGKSTILRMITEGRCLSKDEIFSGTATIDYNRLRQLVGDIEITFFDLSGGSLDRFTGELSEFIFTGLASLVYVVDSINMKEISRTKYYFDRCVEKIDQYSPEASVFIFQHKYDLVPKKLRQEVYKSIKEYLEKDITRNISYYETAVLDTSIIVAMCAVYQASLGYIPNNWFEKG